MKKDVLNEVDLQIINALQIEPRAAWTSLAKVIGLDSVTLSRRWERICSDGLAWITVTLDAHHPRSMAIVEIQCEPGQTLLAADVASRDPAIYSIDLTSGSRDIVMTLFADNDTALSEYILVKLGKLPGVRQVKTSIVNELVKLGSQWSLQALKPRQVAQIPKSRPPRAGAAKVIPTLVAQRVAAALEVNGRATNAELAGALGMGPQRVGDAIATLRQQGSLDIRVVVSIPNSSWPTVSWYFVQMPASSLVAAREILKDMPEVQFACVTSGRNNLVVALSSQNRPDSIRLEVELEKRLQGAVIADRSIVVRVFKNLGHLLDEFGCATGEVVSLLGQPDPNGRF